MKSTIVIHWKLKVIVKLKATQCMNQLQCFLTLSRQCYMTETKLSDFKVISNFTLLRGMMANFINLEPGCSLHPFTLQELDIHIPIV